MKIKKGIFSLLCAFVFASFIISIGAIIYQESVSTPTVLRESEKNQVKDNGAVTTQFNSENVRILKEYKGSIGVFSEGGELLEVINIPVVALPLSERQRLENGIKTKNEQELYSLIEDYTG